jgi:hypothetical protein
MRSGRRTLLDVVDWLFHLSDFGVDHREDRCSGSMIFFLTVFDVCR